MKTRRIAVRGIIFKDGRLLVAKFKQKDGHEPDWWGTFGGGLDSGEFLHDGLHREMLEETGIAPKIGKLLFIQQFADEEKEYLEFFFHLTNPEDYESFDLASTSHGSAELIRAEFIDPKKNTLLPVFLGTIDIAKAIESDQPVYIYSDPR